MMMGVRFSWQKSASYLPLLMAVILCQAVSAQERAPIEIVPNSPHSNFGATSSAISPDGKYLLSGGDGSALKLWDAATGRLVRTFEGHTDVVNAVAYAPDGKYLLSGSRDGTLKLWDPTSGRAIRSFEGHRVSVLDVDFSRDGTRVLSGSADRTVKLWDAASGQLIRSFAGHTHEVVSVAFSPDGRRLLSSGGQDKTLKLWDASTGELIHSIEEPDWLLSVAFSPDGTRILSSVSDRKPTEKAIIRLRDASSGQLIRTFEGHSGKWVHSVKFSPDGKRVLSGGSDKTLRLWDATSGEIIRSFAGHFGQIQCVTFSSDGEYVISNDPRTLRLWETESGRLVRTIEMLSDSVRSVAFSPDGTRLISARGERKKLELWDAATGRLTRPIESTGARDWMTSVAFSPDGTRLISGRIPQLWDAASGQLIRAFAGTGGLVSTVAFSPDGMRLVSGSGGGQIALWDTTNALLIRTFEGRSSVQSVAFSNDGARVVSGNSDHKIELWNVADGKLLRTLEGHSHWVYAVTFSPNGTQLASGSRDETVKLWDATSGELIRTLEGHRGQVNSVAYSPDGTRLISGSEDNTLKLWDAASGRLIRTFEGHSGWVYSAAFSPDGKRLVSGSSDGTVRVWNAATGEVLAILLSSRNGEWLVITPEGFFDASGKGADMLGIVQGLQVYSVDQFYQSLYRPDLVREKLAGDPDGKVKAAVAKLDLARLIGSGRVPGVAIISHKPQDISLVDLVNVEARLTDQGGGIGRAEWRINGITVGVVEKPVAAPGQPVTLKQTMALDPGENTIELTAYNSADLVAAVPASTKITWSGQEPSAPPRLFVMVVGINQYLDSALKLTYAVPDATTLAGALEKAGQNHYQEVIVTKVLDRDATTARLDGIFTDLASKVRPRDVFVFFAAGHGKTHDGRYYFIPYDMRYQTEASLAKGAIDQDRLQAWFARIPARKAVLMFDTCEAGSLTERVVASRGLEQKAALGRLIQATGRATLTASTASQAAYEGYGGHGVFTFALLDALGRADTSSNGLVELTELIQHVDGLVPAITERRWGAKQYPQMDAYGSNFSLARQIEALAPGQPDAMIIPTKPTHVSTEVVSLFKDKSEKDAASEKLQPFTMVTVVRSEAGWLLVARDGKLLGYAPEAKLHKLN